MTLLRSRDRVLAKRITPEGIRDYDNAAAFEVDAVRLDDGIDDLHELLARIADDPHVCIIRGVLRREFAAQRLVLRRSRSRPGVSARFEAAERAWLMVEADSVPLPGGINPVDPLMVGGVVRRALPAAFHRARCIAQLSAGAGIKPGARLHAWFWLNRPISDAEAKRLLSRAPVDLAVYNPVQLHYCANPIFENIDDPCINGAWKSCPA
jgi:hypothetical protein